MVSKASEDLPEPDRPVRTGSVSRGISTSTFLRLCSRAPRMEMFFSIDEIFSVSDGRDLAKPRPAWTGDVGQNTQIFGCYSTDIGRNCENARCRFGGTGVMAARGGWLGHCWGLTRFR